MSIQDVVIVSAARTPIGSFCGSLSSVSASDLGSVVIKEVCARAQLKGEDVDEVIMGQALQANAGQNPARQASLAAGLPLKVPASLINMLCGSGLKTVVNGYKSIKAAEANIIVAGGQENMSLAPHATHLRKGTKLGECGLVDTLLRDGLTDAFANIHMGVTAENLARKYSISREEQDEYAFKSQKKTAEAISNGLYDDEITPVSITNYKKETTLVSQDEYPKSDTTLQGLAKLKPAFAKTDGTVTAGNASGINDGAAAVVMMSAKTALSRGITPLAHIVAVAETGCEPEIMGIGPVAAVEAVLKKAGWTKDEVDLYELNEAFAAQSIACVRELGIDFEKVNVNGGAISLGHPIGCSGARVLVTLLYALKKLNKRKGVASLCIGGGMGIAIAVERK